MASKERIDTLLVDREMVGDLDTARRLVMAGKVRADDQVVPNPSSRVEVQAQVRIDRGPRFVSRGGEKLAAAMAAFPLEVRDQICADVGASTGGFTDCLLQAGAARVYAIDVGYGILDWQLRRDPRVVVRERTNARYLESLPDPVDFITLDVSFISLRRLLPVIVGWYGPGGGESVALIKPQFEASREEAARGQGVITDPCIQHRVLREVLTAAQGEGFDVLGLLESPLMGPEGNREFLAWLGYGQARESEFILDELIWDVVGGQGGDTS